MKLKVVILLIVLLAFSLRFYKVTEIPPALNWDEVSIGYNAYSVLNTARDEWGQLFPVHFRSYGEYKLPVQVYFSIPAIATFGLNELGVRITPVIYGVLTVLVMFFLGRALFSSNLTGLIAAFLLAVSPWHIHLTRASFESSFATFWVTLGILFLVKGFKETKWFIISMIPFALAVFTYNSARIFTPLFLFVILILFRKTLINFKKEVLISLIFFGILMLPLAPYLLSGERSARYKLVSIADEAGLVPRINENRGNSKLPQPLPRLVHNKVTYISSYFIQNYFAHFTPQFLFLSGAPHKQHHVQNIGQLYLFQAPFLILGVIELIRRRQRFGGLLFAWVFLAYIPVAVTRDSIPHALRTLIANPFYQLVSAYGLYIFWEWIKKSNKISTYLITGLISFVVLGSISLFLINLFNIYPVNYSKDWQYGYKQAVEYIGKHKNDYDLIVFSRTYGEPHMFTLFYLNYDPQKYQTDPSLIRYETFDWVWVLKFDKFYFPDLGDQGTKIEDIVAENRGKKMLFIGKKADFSVDYPRLESIKFLNGENAFDIVEVQ